jgi:hypothetical protein
LQQLEVRHFFLDDTGLRVLLTHMSVLTHIWVWTVQLKDSYADVGCTWEALSMYDVSVTSLAHLPLRGIKRVCVDQVLGAITARVAAGASRTAALRLAAAMAAAPDCTSVCSEREGLVLSCRAAELQILLPLLARWQGVDSLQLVTPSGEQLRRATLAALGALLEDMPDCAQLIIKGAIPHPSAQLLPALAHSSVSRVLLDHDRMTEAHLMLWCAGGQASHDVTVELSEWCVFVGSVELVRRTVNVRGSGVHLLAWLHEREDSDAYDDEEDATDSDEDA